MEAQYFGGNCIKISNKKASLVIDDNLEKLGKKSITKPGDIALCTSSEIINTKDEGIKLLVDQPGEYEVSGVSIHGIAGRLHTDEPGSYNSTIFKVVVDDIRICIIGHIYPDLEESQLEDIGTVDILFVPVGGNGFTLDSVGALKVIKKIGPKVIVPTNYYDKSLKYEVPAQELDSALRGLAMEPKETIDKLKLKQGELNSEITQLIVLNAQ